MSTVSVPTRMKLRRERQAAGSLMAPRRPWVRMTGTLACLLGTVIYLIPLAWIISMSVRTNPDAFSGNIVPKTFQLTNYADAWSQFGLATLFSNTAIIAAGTVLLTVAVSALAGYGFARMRTRVSEAWFVVILLGLTVPPIAMIVPFFVVMHEIGLYGTRLSVIVAETAFALPLGVLLMRSYVERIPFDVIDAARVDGAAPLKVFRYVVLPLLRPGLATVALFTLFQAWNDLLLPLVLLPSADQSTLTVGLSTAVQGLGQVELAALAAASVMAALPIIVILFAARRYYVDVFASTGRDASR